MKNLVIGYKGSIGSRHYRLLREAGEEVVGWDVGEHPECKPDMTWICTPNSSHYLYAKDIDGKMFIEKPVTDNLSQAELLRGKQIWVACNYRFHPAIQVLKENLSKVGKVLYCRMHFSHYLPFQRENWKEYMKDTNIVMDVGWHFVDLAQFLFGKICQSTHIGATRELNGIMDMAQIGVFCNHDIPVMILLDYLRRDKSWGIEVIGTEGTIELRCAGKHPEFAWLFCTTKGVLFAEYTGIDDMYRNQLNYLLKEDWKSNLDEVMEVMKICG